MDKIEKIRSEIERLKSKYRHNGLWLSSTQSMLAGAKIEAMNELLLSLDSLQQEQQEEPDKSLEEEVKNYFQGYWPGTETAEQCNTDLHFTPPAIIRLARHFYELGKQAMKEQMLKDAVEGEAEELYNDGESQCIVSVGTYFKPGDEVYVIPKEDEK